LSIVIDLFQSGNDRTKKTGELHVSLSPSPCQVDHGACHISLKPRFRWSSVGPMGCVRRRGFAGLFGKGAREQFIQERHPMTLRLNHQWRLAGRPAGNVKATDFEWKVEPIRDTEDGEFLIRNVYLSIDPTNRVWMNATPSYLPAVQIGDVMRGFAVGVVEESKHPEFRAGDLIQGALGWQEYAVSDGRGVATLRVDLPVPLTAHVGLLGHIGLTAYYGLLHIGKPAAGDTLVVSAAAGAVGSLVGQIGKLKGCRVIGIAGSEEKCKWIHEELGFDAAINYKQSSVVRSLMRTCRDGIDVYFDNVGGETLDAVLRLINMNARIVLCGMISQYNLEKPAPGPSYLANAINKRARLEGFIVMDFADRASQAIDDLVRWYNEGKITYRVDVVAGLERAPEALGMLFEGTHRGKLIVKVSDEPTH
jgi:NADPH-dependent curcumin reductase CurA